MQSLLHFFIITVCIYHSKKLPVVNTLFRKHSLISHAKKEKAFGVGKEVKYITDEVFLKLYEIMKARDNIN